MLIYTLIMKGKREREILHDNLYSTAWILAIQIAQLHTNIRAQPQGRGGGGATLIFSCIHTSARVIFWLKILNLNIFLGFQKNKYFLDMKILRIFFGGHHKIGLHLGVISMHLRVDSKGHGIEWG